LAHSLNLTDIHSGWTESRALLGKSQVAVQQALDEIEKGLPFRLLGVDSDNGSEFINWHLKSWCEQKKIQLTRGRPYKKDDNAHVEQKNWTHVRKLLGWERYDSPAAVDAINDLYRHELRLWLNLYLPSVKLVKKIRVGSKVRRVYDAAQTPLERVLACGQFRKDQAAGQIGGSVRKRRRQARLRIPRRKHNAAGETAVEKPLRGKVPNQTFPPSLQIAQRTRDSHFPTAGTTAGLRLHFQCLDDRPRGYIFKWLDTWMRNDHGSLSTGQHAVERETHIFGIQCCRPFVEGELLSLSGFRG
jgi:hypothetical protein